MNNIPLRILQAVVTRYPAVIPHLKGRARWQAFTRGGEYKTYEFFLDALEGLIQGVYDGNVGGDFIDIAANLISGQLTDAYERAWDDQEEEGDLPDYLTGPLEDMILSQYDFVDGLYREIVDARVDETPIDPLLARAALWAQRWTEAYNEAVHLITLENGGNEIWTLGETEEHCPTCSALNGIIAPASVWEELAVHPQGAPNDLLSCGGWQCDCAQTPTDKRRTPKAYDLILNAVNK